MIVETIAKANTPVMQGNPDPDDEMTNDYAKMKKDQLIGLLKERKIGGFSNKPKAQLIDKLVKYDEEKARLAQEEAVLDQDFGECEQCMDLPNTKATTRVMFKCSDCDLSICGPCEVAHIKTKVTRHHKVESLLRLNLVHRPIPDFAKQSYGGTSSRVHTPE